MQHIRVNRGQIVWALLVLVLHWLQQGRPTPKHAPVIGSYESYTEVVGGIIETASPNWKSWQGNRYALAEIASDGDDLEIVELLEVWHTNGGIEISTTDLAKLAENHQVTLPVKTILGEPFAYNVRSLGKYLAQFSGRLFKLASGATVEFGKSTLKGKSNYPWVLACKEAA